MNVTVEVTEELVANTVNRILVELYQYEHGAGRRAIAEQAARWAKNQNYIAEIQTAASVVVSQVVKDELAKAVAAEVKKQVKALKETGGLTLEQGWKEAGDVVTAVRKANEAGAS